MPTWQPNWFDVDFDFVGAEVAIVECQMLRRALENRDPILAIPLGKAREEWRGPKRIQFDELEARLQKATHQLIEDLRATEVRLSASIASANNEQVRRVRERAQWSDELRVELETERRRLAAQAVEEANQRKVADAAAARAKHPPVAA
jgi:hypothetical protein